MNQEEFNELAHWFKLSNILNNGLPSFAETFNCTTVCVTRDDKGACIYRNNQYCEHDGFRVNVQDTIGEGDVFLAGLIDGIIKRKENIKLLKHANSIGAFVASKVGAQPALDMKFIEKYLFDNSCQRNPLIINE